jgi:hypothetical protein
MVVWLWVGQTSGPSATEAYPMMASGDVGRGNDDVEKRFIVF